jgi:hypothetical protein
MDGQPPLAQIAPPPVAPVVDPATTTLEYATAYRSRLPRISVTLVIVLHLMTFSLFSVFWFNAMHGRLPRSKSDDPSPLKASLLLFIPIVNFYWVFFTWLRLCDRLAEERRSARLPATGLKTLCLVCCILMFVPYVNLLSIVMIQPALFACMQSEVNELHDLGIA